MKTTRAGIIQPNRRVYSFASRLAPPAAKDAWWALSPAQRHAFAAVHMPNWGTTDFDENYGLMSSSTDRHYSSRAYGMERTRYSS